MKTKIYCEPTDRGVHSFFMISDGQRYYLFSQDYRKGVQEYYAKGVSLNESINYSRSHRDRALVRTMNKIPMYVKYIEKEYGIEVFEQTKKRCRYGNNLAAKCA